MKHPFHKFKGETESKINYLKIWKSDFSRAGLVLTLREKK